MLQRERQDSRCLLVDESIWEWLSVRRCTHLWLISTLPSRSCRFRSAYFSQRLNWNPSEKWNGQWLSQWRQWAVARWQHSSSLPSGEIRLFRFEICQKYHRVREIIISEGPISSHWSLWSDQSVLDSRGHYCSFKRWIGSSGEEQQQRDMYLIEEVRQTDRQTAR